MKNEPTISNNKRRVKANPKYPNLQSTSTSTSRPINTNTSPRHDANIQGPVYSPQQLKQFVTNPAARKTNIINVPKKVNQIGQQQHGSSSGLTMQFTRTPKQGKHDSNANPSYTITNHQTGNQKCQKLASPTTSPPNSSISSLAMVNSAPAQTFDGPTSLANLAQFTGFDIVQPVITELYQPKPKQPKLQHRPNVGRTLLANHSSLMSSSSASSLQQPTSSSIFGDKMKSNNLINEHLKTVNLTKTNRLNKNPIITQARANVSSFDQPSHPTINMSLSNISSVQLLNQTSNQDFAVNYQHRPTASISSAIGSMTITKPLPSTSLNSSQQSSNSNVNQNNPRDNNEANNNYAKLRVIKKKQQKQQQRNNDIYQQFTSNNNKSYMSQNFLQSQGEVSQASTSSQYNNNSHYLNIDINNDDLDYQHDGGFVDDIQDEPINYNLTGVGYEDDNDNQLNNATLMKLMSILSNPALTITPINNSSTQRSDEPNGSLNDYNLNGDNINNDNQSSTNNNCNDLTFSMPPIEQLDENVHAIIIGDESNDRNVDISKIVIKSSTDNSLNDTSNNIDNNEANNFDKQQAYLHAIKLARNNHNSINNQEVLQNQLIAPIVSMFEDGKPRGSNNEPNNQEQPLTISTSVRNLILQQSNQQQLDQPKERRQPPTISVELLKQTMMEPCSLTSADDNTNDPHLRSIYGQECASRIPLNMRKLPKAVRVMEKVKSVAISPPPSPKRSPRKQFKPCPYRLLGYEKIPEHAATNSNGQRKELDSQEKLLSTLANIKVVEIGEQNVFLSERHAMLESMMSSGESEDADKDALAIPEPDEIFINRPKKIMSSIDTMIERKKRRRFERISGREAPKTTSYEEQNEDSDAEWDDEGDSEPVDQISFIKTQLPLEEPDNDFKNNHLKSVGLVSRREKNKILLDRSEQKYNKLASMLIEPTNPEIVEEMTKFASEVLRTQGFNPPPWTVGNANLKRSDLALLEGLNRNSSRLKVSYMNSLGLEKKSKRISLYKVKPNNVDESTTTKNNHFIDPKRKRDQNDDNRVNKKTNRNLSSSISHELVSKKPKQLTTNTNTNTDNLKSNPQAETAKFNNLTATQLQPSTVAKFDNNNVQNQSNGIVLGSWEDSVDLIALPNENGNSALARPFCRDLMEPQSKDDYMKSLGLMAS